MKILFVSFIVMSLFLSYGLTIKTNALAISEPVDLTPKLIQEPLNASNLDLKVEVIANDSNLATLGTGVYDQSKTFYYYTTKSNTNWGADKYINVYSLKDKKVIKQIAFDNSGYYKYPISISPSSQKIVIAERSQSVGEVNILVIDLASGKTISNFEKSYAPTSVWLNDDSLVTMFPNTKCINKNFCNIVGINLKLRDLKTNEDNSIEVTNRTQGSMQLDRLELNAGKITIGSKLNKNQSLKNAVIPSLEINVNLLKHE